MTHGSEDIETVSIVDVLIRAHADVTIGKIVGKDEEKHTASLQCKMSRNTIIVWC